MITFKSLNKFAVVTNFLSGNLLPLSNENSEFSWGWKIYSIILWILGIAYYSLTFLGLFLVPKIEAIQYGTVNMVVIIELLILSIYMNFKRNDFKKLMQMINDILDKSDEHKILQWIHRTTNPINKPLRIYVISIVVTIFFWASLPVIKLIYQNKFYYLNFRMPMYFTKEPFSAKYFISGILLQTISGPNLIAKKSSIDVYIISLITLIASEYRYISDELENLFDADNTNVTVNLKINNKCEYNEKILVNVARKEHLKRLIQHHSSVTKAANLLKSLLSLNVALTYGACIFRFCFLLFMLITLSIPIFDKCLIMMYTSGAMIQVFMLCFCAQALLEASTNITNNAFYKEWYKCDLRSQKMYANMMISNNLECRLSAIGSIDMNMSTFTTIMKQSYSACLFLMKINS